MRSYGPADEGPADEGPADEGLDHEASLDGEQVRFGLTVASRRWSRHQRRYVTRSSGLGRMVGVAIGGHEAKTQVVPVGREERASPPPPPPSQAERLGDGDRPEGRMPPDGYRRPHPTSYGR